jgi:predicted lipoprotein with Yx(FWY)xxD motif
MRTRLLVTLLLGALLAACGGQDVGQQPTDPDPTTPAATTPAEEDSTESDTAAADATVATASSDRGTILVDADGMTLYIFDPDAQGPSTCFDGCAASWPPLIADQPVAGDGVDGGLLGTAEREDDGAMQVTYDGWPLYRWAGDDQPGDTTGQGVQDVWWVIAPDGTPIRGEATEAPEPSY